MPETYVLADGTTVTHDPYSCECHETCSWCSEVWPDRRLREQPDGARICPTCRKEARR